jgi:hypothetical protein
MESQIQDLSNQVSYAPIRPSEEKKLLTMANKWMRKIVTS